MRSEKPPQLPSGRLPFLNAYRTICIAPSVDFLRALEGNFRAAGSCLSIAAGGRPEST